MWAPRRFFPAGVDDQGNNLYDIELGGPLDQTYGRMITGSKYDALFNVGFNFNNGSTWARTWASQDSTIISTSTSKNTRRIPLISRST